MHSSSSLQLCQLGTLPFDHQTHVVSHIPSVMCVFFPSVGSFTTHWTVSADSNIHTNNYFSSLSKNGILSPFTFSVLLIFSSSAMTILFPWKKTALIMSRAVNTSKCKSSLSLLVIAYEYSS